jgi:hypothetical protein
MLMGLALEIFDSIKAKEVKDTFATLSVGIVRE